MDKYINYYDRCLVSFKVICDIYWIYQYKSYVKLESFKYQFCKSIQENDRISIRNWCSIARHVMVEEV